MPTTLYSVPDSDIGLRYREPFISAGLNAKYQGFVPVGVYDGFAPTSGTALQLVLLPGSSGYGAAVVTSNQDPAYQISVRITGAQALDLSSFASQEVAVVIEASYTFPSVTTAVIKAYNLTLAEVPPAAACVLATVSVPSSGVIPAANISLKNRTFPWQERTRDSVPFISVVKNGSFDFGRSSSAVPPGANVPPFWAFTGNGVTAINNTTKPPLPSFIGNILVYTSAGSPTLSTGKIRQYIGIPLGGYNGRFRMSIYYNQIVSPTVSFPIFRAEFRRTSDNAAVYSATLPLTSTGTHEITLDLASITTLQSDGNYLAYVEVDANNTGYVDPAPLQVFYISAVEVELEAPAGGAINALLEATGEKRLTKLTLIDPANQSATGSNSDLTYDQATDKVNISSSFGVDDNLSVTGTSAFTGATTHTGGVRTPSVDSIGATALTIGPTNQTGLTVGRVGATTTVRGSTTSIGVNASDGTVTIGRSGGTAAFDSGLITIGAVASGTTTIRSASTVVSGTANVVGNFSVNTGAFTVNASSGATVVSGTLAVTGVTTATGAINANGGLNANGGIGRSSLGTLSIGNDADVTTITIGTANTPGGGGSLGVGISQSGLLTRVYGNAQIDGNLLVLGTTSLGAITISGVDSPSAGGTVTIGTGNASFVDIGNVPNSTTTRVLGPVLLNDALATKSRIDRGNAGTLLIGSSNELTGAGTATSVFLGRAPNSGGTTTSIDGATINVGGNSNTPYASTINIGTQTPNTATITIGTAPTSGTVTTTVQSNTLNLGTDADAATINIGTTAPASGRTITLGANSATQTTTINGGPITIGGSATTTASIVNNASGVVQIARYASGAQVHLASQATGNVFLGSGDGTTGPALVQVGGTTGSPAVINTTLQGDTINLGTNTGGAGAGVKSLVIGRSDVAGVVRFNRYIDGNSTQLDIGTTAQTTTAVNLGRSTVPTVIYGSTVNVGDAVGVTVVGVGANATSAVFGYTAANVGIGSGQSAAGSQIVIGNDTAGTNTTTSIQGDSIFVGTNTGTNALVLGRTTAGSTRVNGYLDGNSSGLSLGTDAATTTGNVSIGRGGGSPNATTVNGYLYLGTATFDRATAGILDIGTANATTVTVGRSGQQLTVNSSTLITAGAISTTSSVTCNTLNINGTTVPEPVYGALTSSTTGAGTLAPVGSATYVLIPPVSPTFSGTNCLYSGVYNGVYLNGLTGWTGYISFYFTISLDISSNPGPPYGAGIKLALLRSTSLTTAPSVVIEEQVFFANATITAPQLLPLTALFGRVSLSSASPYNWGVGIKAQSNSYAIIYYSGLTLTFHSH